MSNRAMFHPCVNIDAENKAISIWLESVPEYGEWIQHEGADMCLYRAIDDHRVVGARLPLRHFDGSFSVHGLPHGPENDSTLMSIQLESEAPTQARATRKQAGKSAESPNGTN